MPGSFHKISQNCNILWNDSVDMGKNLTFSKEKYIISQVNNKTKGE